MHQPPQGPADAEQVGQEVAATARRWVLRARARLVQQRPYLDSLNVYPVPDGDTGTNMARTLDAGVAAVRGAGPALVEQAEALARGVLLGARGNSGVILSQLVRGAMEVLRESGRVDAPTMAAGFVRADALAWSAVESPVEGTVLTVSSAAAAAAREAAATTRSPAKVVDAALAAAEQALAATREQLPALRRAGVVDAGGAGYVVVLRALADTVHGQRRHLPLPPTGPLGPNGADSLADTPEVAGQHGGDAGYAGPAYEVMYRVDVSADHAADLRAALGGLGDSVVVGAGDAELTVHVHTDDVSAATGAGLALGRIRDLRVTELVDGHPEPDGDGPAMPGCADAAGEPTVTQPATGIGLVACADGPGIAALFEDAGAVAVLSTPGARASTGDLLDAARRTGARDVLVLTNDRDAHLAAAQAAREAHREGWGLHVVPTTSQLQGIAGAAVFDPALTPADSVAALTAAAKGVRTGFVSRADRDAETDIGHVAAGQALGLAAGRAVAVGDDIAQVATAVVDALLAEGGELVTLVVGDPAVPGLAEAAEGRALGHPGVEVSVLAGGQPVFPLLVGVE